MGAHFKKGGPHLVLFISFGNEHFFLAIGSLLLGDGFLYFGFGGGIAFFNLTPPTFTIIVSSGNLVGHYRKNFESIKNIESGGKLMGWHLRVAWRWWWSILIIVGVFVLSGAAIAQHGCLEGPLRGLMASFIRNAVFDVAWMIYRALARFMGQCFCTFSDKEGALSWGRW